MVYPEREDLKQKAATLKTTLCDTAKELLTKRQYQIFTMHFVEGKSEKQICQELNTSKSNVSNLYVHALDTLRDYWNLSEI